jgi:hypothetical protein|tara:strand:+ start:1041 stop:1307 length:267 start_codon:yes stop_codon:yes gene_type:complete
MYKNPNYQEDYRKNNAENIAETRKKYYALKGEELKEKGRERYKSQEVKDRKRAYYLKNKEKILARAKEKYLEKKKEQESSEEISPTLG